MSDICKKNVGVGVLQSTWSCHIPVWKRYLLPPAIIITPAQKLIFAKKTLHMISSSTIDMLSEFRLCTVYPKKYAHGYCFAVLCCGYTLTDYPISIRLTSLVLWQSNDCHSASKATLMNMDKYFMWIHYERLHNHNKAKHKKTVCIFLGIYCTYVLYTQIKIKYSMTGMIVVITFYKISYTQYPIPSLCSY